MKTLHLIVRRNRRGRISRLFEAAAKNRNIKVNYIVSDSFNFADTTPLTKEDGLYRISCRKSAFIVEQHLLNNHVKSVYHNLELQYGRVAASLRDTALFEKNNLPTIPSFPIFTKDSDHIQKYLNQLGNFPFIIKALGGMKGIGVMKLESFESLRSVTDYLSKQEGYFLLQKYIPHEIQARITVLGENVLTSHANYTTTDFRTNRPKSEDRKDELMDFSKEIQEIAIKSVHTLGYEFGGVDVLIEKETNTPYLAEVNLPCDFIRASEISGIDIAGSIIDHMIAS